MTLCTSSYRRNKAAEALRELVHAHLQRAEVYLLLALLACMWARSVELT